MACPVEDRSEVVEWVVVERLGCGRSYQVERSVGS